MTHRSWAAAGFSIFVGLGCTRVDAVQIEQVAESTDELRISLGGARSGSRLKAEFLETSDGFTRFEQFHDTALDSPCNFSPDENGEWRCIPEIGAFLQYLDAACTEPVLVERTGATTIPAYFNTGAREETCTDFRSGNRFIAWTRGAEVTTTTVYSSFSGSCFPSPIFPGQIVHRAEHVDPEELVLGEFGFRFAGGWRLVEEVIFGEDGSRSHVNLYTGSFLRSMYDWVLDTHVVFAPTQGGVETSGKGLWVGAGGQELSLFADDTCTTRSALVSCGPQEHTVVSAGPPRVNEAACRLEVDYLEVTDTEVDEFYVLQGEMCMERERPAILTDPVFEIGGPLDTSIFLQGRLARRAFGRISVVEIKNHDGSRVPYFTYDEELEASCSFFDFSGEETNFYCLPQSSFNVAYSDPACTQPVVALRRLSGLEAQACFDGVRQAFSFDFNDLSRMIRTTGGALISSTPIPIYDLFDTQCFPGGEGLAYTVESEAEVELAHATRVRR